MRIVIQRVTEASVAVNGNTVGAIGKGYMILVGVENADTQEDAKWLARKVASLRVFDDEAGVMNRDIRQTEGSVLAISQFTLFASYKRTIAHHGFAHPNKPTLNHSTITSATNWSYNWAQARLHAVSLEQT